jgi:hypothetical protein
MSGNASKKCKKSSADNRTTLAENCRDLICENKEK